MSRGKGKIAGSSHCPYQSRHWWRANSYCKQHPVGNWEQSSQTQYPWERKKWHQRHQHQWIFHQDLCITSDEALSLEDLNTETVVAIIGGGYIAVEFSGIFNGLGATVHLMYRKPFPLRGSVAMILAMLSMPSSSSFDQECRERVAENLTARGVNTHPGCSPQE